MTLFQVIQAIYSVSAIGLWGTAGFALLRFGRPALTIGAELVSALTRMSDAMRTSVADSTASREATTRIEDACERIEREVREVRVLLAGRAPMPSAHDEERPKRAR